jgi:hypothetical protein
VNRRVVTKGETKSPYFHFSGRFRSTFSRRRRKMCRQQVTLHLVCCFTAHDYITRSQWPSGLRSGSAATRLLGLRVRIPPEAWMFVLYSKRQNAKPRQSGQRSTEKYRKPEKKKSRRGHVCLLWVLCLSGRGLCDGLITRLQESYRLCCVTVWSRNLKNEGAKTLKWVVKASRRRIHYTNEIVYFCKPCNHASFLDPT